MARLTGCACFVRRARHLIGEHTDYNFGFVLPVALDVATFAATAPAADGKLRLHSIERQETREFDVAGLAELSPAHHWTTTPSALPAKWRAWLCHSTRQHSDP